MASSESTTRCPTCGTELRTANGRCNVCRHDLESLTTAPKSQPAPAPTLRSRIDKAQRVRGAKRSTRGYWLVAALVGPVGGMGAWRYTQRVSSTAPEVNIAIDAAPVIADAHAAVPAKELFFTTLTKTVCTRIRACRPTDSALATLCEQLGTLAAGTADVTRTCGYDEAKAASCFAAVAKLSCDNAAHFDANSFPSLIKTIPDCTTALDCGGDSSIFGQ